MPMAKQTTPEFASALGFVFDAFHGEGHWYTDDHRISQILMMNDANYCPNEIQCTLLPGKGVRLAVILSGILFQTFSNRETGYRW